MNLIDERTTLGRPRSVPPQAVLLLGWIDELAAHYQRLGADPGKAYRSAQADLWPEIEAALASDHA
jgi:hypothetical protein